MTTPESLALLLSYDDADAYFGDLRYIIIDELHAFFDNKRGDLLSLNLARLSTIAPGGNPHRPVGDHRQAGPGARLAVP